MNIILTPTVVLGGEHETVSAIAASFASVAPLVDDRRVTVDVLDDDVAG